MSEDVPRVYRRGVDRLTLSVISCWDCEFGFECAAERATRCLKLNESACEFGKNGVQSANGGYTLNRPNPTEAVDTRRHSGRFRAVLLDGGVSMRVGISVLTPTEPSVRQVAVRVDNFSLSRAPHWAFCFDVHAEMSEFTR
ncbi:MAG: hypothetical protein J07HQW1_03362 [Haloquadratum walsbyi J07HQW1]|jgi:hypothetical protein|uniref:Uncharacterized protein n=1 Tax=Haloquadratum walsbyi J07HQW1 TaxID=1238424 RepID=U1PM46_9EURY|nr:MAG: hypothetical protein J07HQW1_03362 [Haloquadratum walsbyi J07HQW1]